MKRFNIIMLVDEKGENVLMCHRLRPPYQGLYNLVGGKAEPGEDGLHAAYRELREETGVTAADVTLTLLAVFSYPTGGAGLPAYELEAYVGRLRKDISVTGEENPLLWMPLTENFFDLEKYAGEGSIGHVVETVRRYRPWLIEPCPPQVTLVPLDEADLPILAFYQGCPVETLRPMLNASKEKCYEGRCFEHFMVRVNDCIVGNASLFEQEDGAISHRVEIFPQFCKCGFESRALMLLQEAARARGLIVQSTDSRGPHCR